MLENNATACSVPFKRAFERAKEWENLFGDAV